MQVDVDNVTLEDGFGHQVRYEVSTDLLFWEAEAEPWLCFVRPSLLPHQALAFTSIAAVYVLCVSHPAE